MFLPDVRYIYYYLFHFLSEPSRPIRHCHATHLFCLKSTSWVAVLKPTIASFCRKISTTEGLTMPSFLGLPLELKRRIYEYDFAYLGHLGISETCVEGQAGERQTIPRLSTHCRKWLL